MHAFKISVIVLIKLIFNVVATDNYCRSDNEDCVVFTSCPEAKKLAEIAVHEPKLHSIFSSSLCGNSRRRDCVLCSNFKPQSNGLASDLLPSLDECGISPVDEKIYHGDVTKLDDYPWIVLLKYKNKTGHFEYKCHGSIINKRYIVTAGHCITLSVGSLYSVILGEYDTNTTNDCIDDDCADPIQEFSVDNYRVFPRNNDNHNDIAILRLNGTITYSDFVKPICLPFNITGVKHREPLWIAGWGKTENKTLSNVKRHAKIEALRANECAQRIPFMPDDSEICAGSDSGQDSCHGDSGGPLMAIRQTVNKESNTFLVGIVSWGSMCGARAALYVNVFKFREWILETMINMEKSRN